MRYRPQDFVICCDMDDTIEYLLPAWIRWLNTKYGYNTKYSDVLIGESDLRSRD